MKVHPLYHNTCFFITIFLCLLEFPVKIRKQDHAISSTQAIVQDSNNLQWFTFKCKLIPHYNGISCVPKDFVLEESMYVFAGAGNAKI